MNPTELKWVVRIILKRISHLRFKVNVQEMRVGATEKTFFDCWHADADKLFNVTSSLRKVCWDLYDPNSRLEDKVRTFDLSIMLSDFRIQTSSCSNVINHSLQASIKETFNKLWTLWVARPFGSKRSLMVKGSNYTSGAENFASFQGTLDKTPPLTTCKKSERLLISLWQQFRR